MTIHEFGKENKKVMLMLHPLGVQWDVFEYVIPALEERFHLVIPAIPGMDSERPDSTFTSVEDIARELGKWLKGHGHQNIACMYGCSMGGAILTRMLADAQIVPEHIIIDGGITPYQLPKVITYFIAIRDWCMTELGKHASTKILRGLFPEEKYSEEDLAYVKKCLKGMSAKTIWRSFYSSNNYDMPDEVKQPSCPMQYWYGSEEKKERKWDIAYIRKTFPKTGFVEIPGVGHAEYFTLHPEKFVKRVLHFVRTGE